jgi:hypothetical protein
MLPVRRVLDTLLMLAAVLSMAAAPVTHAVAHTDEPAGQEQVHPGEAILAGVDQHEAHGHLTPALPRADDSVRDTLAAPPMSPSLAAAPPAHVAPATASVIAAHDAARAPPTGRAPPAA